MPWEIDARKLVLDHDVPSHAQYVKGQTAITRRRRRRRRRRAVVVMTWLTIKCESVSYIVGVAVSGENSTCIFRVKSWIWRQSCPWHLYCLRFRCRILKTVPLHTVKARSSVGIRWRCLCCLGDGDGANGIHWMGVLVDSRVPLGRCGKDINLLPLTGIEPGYLGVPATALLLSRLSYPGHHVPPTLGTNYQTTRFHNTLVPPTRLHGSITRWYQLPDYTVP